MSLLERIQKAQACAVVGCGRHREPDALVCRDDLTALWRNQLDRQLDGTYVRRRSFRARDLTGAIRSAA